MIISETKIIDENKLLDYINKYEKQITIEW